MRLTVLGGSSPFAAGLIDALAAEPMLRRGHLTLFGRSKDALNCLSRYALLRLADLDWTVSVAIDLVDAITDADVILHLIRYGGLEVRRQAEIFAGEWNIIADETLGPAAMYAIIQMLPEFRQVVSMIAARAPNCWILNLTNPLSITTKLFIDAGLTKTIGLCELPEGTAKTASARLGLPFETVNWFYHGLNHRGFVTKLNYGGVDMIPRYLRLFGTVTVPDCTLGHLEGLHAIPTKYFQLLVGRLSRDKGSRANELIEIRDDILAELRRSPTIPPPSLSRRRMDWYPHAVVPALKAVASREPVQLVVNGRAESGLVEEFPALVNSEVCEARAGPAPELKVQQWLSVFRKHEFAQLLSIETPSAANFHGVASCDPLVPASRANAVGMALWDVYRRSERF